MKLELKKETTETVELNPPMFWINADNDKAIAFLDADTVINCSNYENIKAICNQNLEIGKSELRKTFDPIYKFKQVSELEFLTWYDDLLQSISLEPKLTEQV